MEPYIPELLPEDDVKYFSAAGFGQIVGWGETVGLVIVDMTQEFISAESGLGREDTANRAIESINNLLPAYRQLNQPVFYTTPEDHFPSSYPGTTKAIPNRESRRNGGNQIAPLIKPTSNDIVIRKPRASAFFDTHFSNMLREYEIDTLIVTGMTTSGCVRATVVDSHSSNFNTIVPVECVADRSVGSHEISLFDMDMKYADVMETSEVINELEQFQ